MRVRAALLLPLFVATLATLACSGRGGGRPRRTGPHTPTAQTVDARLVSATLQAGPPFVVVLDVETTVAGDGPIAGSTTCSSIFDATSLVLTDASGHELLRQPHDATCSPYAEAQPVTLPGGTEQTMLRFVLTRPLEVTGARAALDGHLAGLPDALIHTEAVPVTRAAPLVTPPPDLPPDPPAEPLPSPTDAPSAPTGAPATPTAPPTGGLPSLGNHVGHAPEWDMWQRQQHPVLAPRVALRPITGQGPLEPEAVRRVLLRNLAQLQHCYAVGLTAQPNLEGAVTLRFTVHAVGSAGDIVAAPDAGLEHVAACMALVVRRSAFPHESEDTHVEVPLALSLPAGG